MGPYIVEVIRFKEDHNNISVQMAFLKLAKLAVGGAASFIFLTGNTVKAQEILETNCENQTKKTERSTMALPQVYFILRQGNSLIVENKYLNLRTVARILCRGDHSYGYKFT